jgi:hypothetical protein
VHGTEAPMIPFAERTRTRMREAMREAEHVQRQAFLSALAQADGPVTYEDLSVALDLNPGLVRTRMRELLDEGLIEPTGEVVELAAAHRRLNAQGR